MLYRSIRGQVRRITKRYPALKRSGQYIEYLIWMFRFSFLRFASSQDLDLIRSITIDPSHVKFALLPSRGPVMPSESQQLLREGWDMAVTPFPASELTTSLEEHFSNHVAWEDTPLASRTSNLSIMNSDSAYDYTERGQENLPMELDGMYRKIRNASNHTEYLSETTNAFSDRIGVAIDRYGRLIVTRGAIYLALARFMGVTSLSVAVDHRHKNWLSFKEALITFIKSSSGRAYQALLHPDLQQIPTLHSDGRFALIMKNLPIHRGTVLDLGAHWGYFSQRFEEKGFDVIAYEVSPIHTYFMRRLRNSLAQNFDIRCASFLDNPIRERVDVVLALNIFHHFVKNRSEYLKLCDFLRQLDAKYMIFEPDIANSPQMRNAYKPMNPDEFVNFVLEHSKFREASLIGHGEGNRPVYFLH